MLCFNNSCIRLLTLFWEVYGKLLEKRFWLIVELHIQEQLCGFNPGCGMVEKLFTFLCLLGAAWAFSNLVYILCFVDLQEAYDLISWGALWGTQQ